MSISGIAKAVWRREPAILAGLIATATFFFSTRYGSNANGATQSLGSGVVFLVFTTLRGFVTSPAGKDLLTRAQNNLPGFIDDVHELIKVLAPLRATRGGPLGFLKALDQTVATHRGDVEQATADAIARVHGVIRGSTTAPATLTAPAAEPVAVAPPATPASPGLEGAAADLGALLGVKATA